jgi:DNA recombination protein RmuC
MNEILFSIGTRQITSAELLLALALAALVLLIALAIGLWRTARRRGQEATEQVLHTAELEERIGELVRTQAETSGQLQSFATMLGGRQAELARVVTERLDSVSHRLGEGMQNSARVTNESLSQLHERLAVVDAAQARLAELSTHMVSLKDVLANKQSRGAFGQGRMEAIVADGLPKDAYNFQHTLKNNRRPDCVIFLPGDHRPLVIDAKFPLEAITSFRGAKTDDERTSASQQLRQDIGKHVSNISDRYLIAGETQEVALMFVPSESVYADIYENFDDVMQKAFRERVMLVSPSLLMLAIQVVQTIVQDARMREQAEAVRTEVSKLMEDVRRLHDRALKLQSHFSHVSEDVAGMTISAEKVLKRGARIEALELDDIDSAKGEPAPLQAPLKLRIGAAE